MKARKKASPTPLAPGAPIQHALLLAIDAEGFAGFAGRFSLMTEIVEGEIRRRWPSRLHEPRSAFKLSCPSAPTRSSEALMRAHVRELLSRLPDSGDPDPRSGAEVWRTLALLTRAELLGIFSAASLRAPLAHYECVAFELLFLEVFPETTILERRTLFRDEDREARTLLEERLRAVAPDRVATVNEAWEDAKDRAKAEQKSLAF